MWLKRNIILIIIISIIFTFCFITGMNLGSMLWANFEPKATAENVR